jgi:branched-chain amino acid transport system permease protein
MPAFPKKLLWVLLALAFLVPLLQPVLPEVVSNYRLFLVSTMIIAAIAVLGLNLLTGFNGQISLGHSAFYAVGAYTAAILMDKLDMPYYATLPIAAVMCFIVGYLFGLPALKLEGHYLALATFALALSVPQILKYKWLEDLTGGVQGIVLSKPEVPFGLPLNEDQWLYYYCLVVMVLLYWAAANILNSRSGRAMMAIRDQYMAADTMGIDTALYKTVTFGISAAYTGVAGALSASAIAFVAPDSFNFFLSIRFGGRRHLLRAGRQLCPGTLDVRQERPRPAVRPLGLYRVRYHTDRAHVSYADGHRGRRLLLGAQYA